MNFTDIFNFIFKKKVYGKGHWEEEHWIPAPYYWTWKWNN